MITISAISLSSPLARKIEAQAEAMKAQAEAIKRERERVLPVEAMKAHLKTAWLAEQIKLIDAYKEAEPYPGCKIKRIIAATAAEHGMTLADVMSRSRKQSIVDARAACVIAVMTARPNFSLSETGRYFGLDHTTILYIVQRHVVRTQKPFGNPPWTPERARASLAAKNPAYRFISMEWVR